MVGVLDGVLDGGCEKRKEKSPLIPALRADFGLADASCGGGQAAGRPAPGIHDGWWPFVAALPLLPRPQLEAD